MDSEIRLSKVEQVLFGNGLTGVAEKVECMERAMPAKIDDSACHERMDKMGDRFARHEEKQEAMVEDLKRKIGKASRSQIVTTILALLGVVIAQVILRMLL